MSPPSPTRDHELDRRLRDRLVHSTCARVAAAAPVHVLGAILLVPLLPSPDDLGRVLGCAGSIAALALLTGLLARRASRTEGADTLSTELLAVGASLVGLAWSLSYVLLSEGLEPARQTGLLVLLVLIGASAVPVLAALAPAANLHALCLYIPMATQHLLGDGPGEMDLGLMIVALAAAQVLVMSRIRRARREAVQVSLDKQDLTARLNHEVVRQRRSERYYRHLLENSSDLITVLGPDGAVLFESESAGELVGEGSTAGEPVRSAMDRVHPEDRPLIRAAQRKLADLPEGEAFHFEYRLKDRQGRWRLMAAAGRRLTEGASPSAMVLSSRDITERSEMAAELAQQRDLLQALIDAAPDPIFYKDLDGAYLGCNAAYAGLVGRPQGELVGRTDEELHSPDLARRSRERDRLVAEQGEIVRHEEWLDAPDGRRLLLDTVKAPFRDARGRPAGIVGVCRDVTEQKRLEDKLRALAVTDGLTGLMNRRRLDEVLGEEWARARRQGTPVSLLMVDIDHFKPFNDHYGHPEGDRVLARVGQLLRGQVQRPGDVVARYGGEEFSLVLPFTDEEGAMTIARRVREAVAGAAIPHTASPQGPLLTLSVGVATGRPGRDQPASALLDAADRALYAAKQAGRDTIRREDPPADS